ncbi:MAG TPA: 30S ribosomal protein S17e [Candidatus Lokiarchaeia archaeon]|nr:30S ribosomal protein S17e [Candidatus Lokiarchaeia archaeon]
MGKVRPDFIKRVAKELINKEPKLYSSSFEENKQILNQITDIKTKRFRNRIAGYITSLIKLKNRQA